MPNSLTACPNSASYISFCLFSRRAITPRPAQGPLACDLLLMTEREQGQDDVAGDRHTRLDKSPHTRSQAVGPRWESLALTSPGGALPAIQPRYHVHFIQLPSLAPHRRCVNLERCFDGAAWPCFNVRPLGPIAHAASRTGLTAGCVPVLSTKTDPLGPFAHVTQ